MHHTLLTLNAYHHNVDGGSRVETPRLLPMEKHVGGAWS